MTDKVKINQLELENIKRIQAVTLTPSEKGLTVIGGKNQQGKSSVLDAIAWVLGGDKFKPSQPQHKGTDQPPNLKIELSNGLIVERKGKNSALTVTDKDGMRGGQKLLDAFIDQLALDLPKFLEASSKEKANILLRVIGVGEELKKLELAESEAYNERLAVGRVLKDKQGAYKEMPVYKDAPEGEISVADLADQLRVAVDFNVKLDRRQNRLEGIRVDRLDYQESLQELEETMRSIKEKMAADDKEEEEIEKFLAENNPIDTADLEKRMRSAEDINAQVRANKAKEIAKIDGQKYRKQYDDLDAKIEKLRKDKLALLDGADLPLKGLSVENGELTYEGFAWDNIAASERLKVATAIVRKLNPNCGFVLMDKLEQMDNEVLLDFGEWLQEEGLQVIATRVGTGNECSVIIEDGLIKE